MDKIFNKHLIFSNISLDPAKQGSPVKVVTSDGLDLTEYFHITSLNVIATWDKLTEINLTIYASVGTK